MQAIRSPQQEAAEDIFFGQVVIIWARWFLILAGAVLILWSTTETGQLVTGILPILALMGMNFFLHGRYLVERPVTRWLLMVTSSLDLALISLLVFFWEPGGLENQFFIFYYPVVLAVGFVFPRRHTVVYTALALAAYAAVVFVSDFPIIREVENQKTLVQRVITIAAMGGLGRYYWRIQRDRLRAVTGRASR